MLNTQIQYWANQETKRHNIETETQTWEDLRRKELEYLQEVKYQAEQVGYWYDQLKEEIRHNKQQEKIGAKQATAALKQAYASLTTAHANMMNASTNAKNARTKRLEYQSTASFQKAMSDKAKSEKRAKQAEAKYKDKQTKYYFWSDVVPKYLNTGSKVLDNIGGPASKLGKVSNIKKALKK